MNADKQLKQAMRSLARAKSGGGANLGGIKMIPTLTHGDEAPVRSKNVPVIDPTARKVDPDAYIDFE